jgi:hypothetical protein
MPASRKVLQDRTALYIGAETERPDDRTAWQKAQRFRQIPASASLR